MRGSREWVVNLVVLSCRVMYHDLNERKDVEYMLDLFKMMFRQTLRSTRTFVPCLPPAMNIPARWTIDTVKQLPLAWYTC
ncbi:hypothetical protein ES702_03608 [subsurface metagenome]